MARNWYIPKKRENEKEREEMMIIIIIISIKNDSISTMNLFIAAKCFDVVVGPFTETS